MNYKNLTVEINDELLWIGFGKYEKKSMTTFTRDTLEELKVAIQEAADLDKKKAVKGLVFFSHKPGVFLAGVDISVINNLKTENEALRALDEAHAIFNALDDLK